MKTILMLLLLLLLTPLGLLAALPPNHQNAKDMDAMVAFSKKHMKIMRSLKSINLTTRTVYFGNNCQAVFTRKILQKKKGWAGPAEPLEFKYSTCSL